MSSAINVQVNKYDKERASKVLDNLGLNMSTAINIYIKKIISTYSIPFEVKNNDLLVSEEEMYNDTAYAYINVQVNKNDKKILNVMLKELGINITTAINMFLKQIINTNSIPFYIGNPIPTDELIKAIEEGEKILNDNNRHGYDNISDLIKSLEEE